MNRTVKIRDAMRNFFFSNARWLKIVGKGLIALCSFLIINHYFGYIDFLTDPLFAIVLAIACAFIPMRAGGLIVMIYTFVQLTGLSGQVALVALILMVVSCGISIFYGAKHIFNISYIPIALQIQMPYPIVVGSALVGEMRDVTSVICGGLLSFYFKTIRENASLFLEENSDVTVIDVIAQKMVVNPLLYIYVASLVAMFVAIILIRNLEITRSWLVAIVTGIFIEMAFMLIGYVTTGNLSKVPMLIVANAVSFVVGFAMTYIFRDLDYERVERVQFEDDDYVYYVTAIPKIELAKEEKRVTRITRSRKGFYNAGKVEDKPSSMDENKE
ncbi:MAG TPA: hypothetical protein DCR12_07950 [Lachnospiraceae bacterium]|nr:hypothetical protein [Lachnospiraceae bacterium]